MKVKRFLIGTELIKAIVLLMWVYAVVSKLINPAETRAQLNNQVFTPNIASALFYLIPIAESLVIGLLFFRKSQFLGYLGSIVLLSAFTLYIILIKLSYFGRIPCSCGGILSGFTWTQHLLFNILFLGLSLSGLLLTIKERRTNGKAT